MCFLLKKEGFGKLNHKIPIAPKDMKKLYKQCRRGRENLRFLKTDFAFKVSKDGKYIKKAVDEIAKNRRENEDAEEGEYILATGTKCPINAFKFYLSILNPP